MSLKGLKEVNKSFDLKMRKLTQYTEYGIDKACEHLMDIARPLAPIDTGELRKSGGVDNLNTTDTIVREVSFQAFSDEGYDYAIIQHENLNFNHPRGGQAKYLEQPFKEETDRMIEIIATSIKKELDND